METGLVMDKKNLSRVNGLQCRSSQEPSKNDFIGKKNGQQFARKREHEKADPPKRLAVTYRGNRAGQRNVRTREKMGGQVENVSVDMRDSEYGSLQCFGSKKQNITHLLNWWGPGPIDHSRHSNNTTHSKRYKHTLQRYNKEQFLQANCQFIVSVGGDYSDCNANPDYLVNWDYIEEIQLHASEPAVCPICLYPPSAAKITRCGHIYCYPCVLHYLALSDDKWRKCPICFEPIQKDDLKSVKVILRKECSLGEEIELQLMRRERDSLIPLPVSAIVSNQYEVPFSAVLPFSKLILATKEEVVKYILEPEIGDLELKLSLEGDQPEACFIEESLNMLNRKKTSLLGLIEKSDDVCSRTSDNSSSVMDLNLVKSLQKLSLLSPEEASAMHSIADKAEGGQFGSLINKSVLDISQLPATNSQENRNSPKQTFYFYQASNGAHIYLQSINVQMLIKEYGSLEECPLVIKGKVVDREPASMNEDLRQRLRYLRHLPLTCNFDIVELELESTLLSESTLAEFKEWLDQRERKRKKRAREERKVERKAKAEEDRLMGRSRGKKMNLQSQRHFPIFAAEEQILSEGIVDLEMPTLSSSMSSDCNSEQSGPSFAQMIRDGHVPSSGNVGCMWPAMNSAPAPTTNSSALRNRTASGGSAITDEEEEKAPDFSASFSNAFAKAWDDAIKLAPESCEKEVALCGGGKRKKKKKGILLLSSGGR